MIFSRARGVRNAVVSVVVTLAAVLGMAATPADALPMYAGDSILSLQGDSGSLVYTVNPDGSANIVGIISGAAHGMFVAVDAATPLPAGLR